VAKDNTLVTQTKAIATSRKRSQKVNKSQTPKVASTTHLPLLLTRTSTSVIAIQQSRWINLLLDIFLRDIFCKELSYIYLQLICSVVGDFFYELRCIILRPHNTKAVEVHCC